MNNKKDISLELNQNHKRIDLSKIEDPLKKIKVFALGVVLTTSVYGNSLVPEKTYAEDETSYEIEEMEDSYISNIPYCYQSCVENACGKSMNNITQSDIEAIESLNIEINDSESLDFLDSFTSLVNLKLDFCNTNDEYCLDTIPYIPSLSNLTITANEDLEISSVVNNEFITNNADNIEELTLNGVTIGPDAIENFTNLRKLTLSVSLNNDINFENLDVQELDLSWYGAYDVPIFLNRESCEILESKGTNINFGSSSCESEYKQLLDTLDNIVEELNVDSNSSDQDKLDEVLCYVLDEYKYDEKIKNALENEEDISKYNVSDTYYKKGNLYSAFVEDGNHNGIICGTYAALVKTLLKMLEIDSAYLFSSAHSWNLVEVEGETYYVDATVMDLDDGDIAIEKIEEGRGYEVDWYMENVDEDNSSSFDQDHDPVLFPKYLGYGSKSSSAVYAKPQGDTTNIDDNEFKLSIKGVNYKIPGAVAVGILFALGAARRKSKKKKRKTPTNIDRYITKTSSVKHNPEKKGYEDFPFYYGTGSTNNKR